MRALFAAMVATAVLFGVCACTQILGLDDAVVDAPDVSSSVATPSAVILDAAPHDAAQDAAKD